MIRKMASFAVEALTSNDYLRKHWQSTRWARNAAIAGVLGTVVYCALFPQSVGTWYWFALLHISPMNDWLMGGWFLMILAALLFQYLETTHYINSLYRRRYKQSTYLTNHGGGDDIFARFMAEGDIQKYLGAAEKRLVRNVFSEVSWAVTETIVLRIVIFLPAAIIATLTPFWDVALILTAGTAVSLSIVSYAPLGMAKCIFNSLLSIPLTIMFLYDGLLAAFCAQVAVVLTIAFTEYATTKLFARKYARAVS
ncbi:MAG: hypothetical protein C0507_12225 [Cyanobacteria bacterium PR.3.49]|nr:hypothetical protein [Cyanobacteria bacterium PR.3.49]